MAICDSNHVNIHCKYTGLHIYLHEADHAFRLHIEQSIRLGDKLDVRWCYNNNENYRCL